MGPAMPLINVVMNLESLDREATIYVAKPWTSGSLALIDYEPPSGDLPDAASRRGLTYFLEVFVALAFISDWQATLDKPPTDQQRCERLIRYAVDDA